MPKLAVAFLGPIGTYSHLVAEKRFGRNAQMFPLETISDVFAYVARHRGSCGIVPVENSSGGVITETIDILMSAPKRLQVQEELSLNVKLALLGHRTRTIERIYSHFAPIEHCNGWLKTRLPKAERIVVTSTAAAAQQAVNDPGGAALASRRLAQMTGLSVLHYPIEEDVPNLTVFLVIGNKAPKRPLRAAKTSLSVRLPNVPGSLCSFLEAFRIADVNLNRIVSRPIRGSPRQYAFLVDIEGDCRTPHIAATLVVARQTCVELNVVGCYHSRKPYTS